MAKSINPNLKLKPRSLKALDEYLNGLKRGDRFYLSEVLTLVESNNAEQRLLGEQVLNNLDLTNSNTLRIGITGSPGVGKSTFIELLGNHYIDLGKKVAVLAIDPSSSKSHGSILGDKTRMHSLSTNESAFVRPTASANMLGGVAQATKESISLCEAAGYDIILIETVGVGQSETALAGLVDMYLLLLLPGGGDGVQGIKRGVVELADMMIVNKYDGNYKLLAEQSRKDFALSSTLFNHDLPQWKVPVVLCSSTTGIGIDIILEHIESFITLSKTESFFENKRKTQDQNWLSDQIKKVLMHKASQLFITNTHFEDNKELTTVFKLLQQVRADIEADFKLFMNLKNKVEGE